MESFRCVSEQLDSEGQLARLGIEPVTEPPQRYRIRHGSMDHY